MGIFRVSWGNKTFYKKIWVISFCKNGDKYWSTKLWTNYRIKRVSCPFVNYWICALQWCTSKKLLGFHQFCCISPSLDSVVLAWCCYFFFRFFNVVDFNSKVPTPLIFHHKIMFFEIFLEYITIASSFVGISRIGLVGNFWWLKKKLVIFFSRKGSLWQKMFFPFFIFFATK